MICIFVNYFNFNYEKSQYFLEFDASSTCFLDPDVPLKLGSQQSYPFSKSMLAEQIS